MYKINKYIRNSKIWRIKEKKIINKKKVELLICCYSKSKLNICIYIFYVIDIILIYYMLMCWYIIYVKCKVIFMYVVLKLL